MSCYIDFYVKIGEKFAPIGSSSRNGTLFHYFEHRAPWEKARALTKQEINEIASEMHDDLADWEHREAQVQNKYNMVGTFNNSVADKMEALAEVEEELGEVRETIDELRYAIHFVEFLGDIISEVEYTESDYEFDPAHYVYVGMESGYIPEIQEG